MKTEVDLSIEKGITGKAIVTHFSDGDGSWIDLIQITQINYHPHDGLDTPMDLAFHHVGGDINETNWEAKVLAALEFEAEDYIKMDWPAEGFNEYYGFWSRIKHRNLPDAP